MLFVHGWPGSFLEAIKIITQKLTNGGEQPALHLVAPSLPNFGFSEGTKRKGFAIEQYAQNLQQTYVKA